MVAYLRSAVEARFFAAHLPDKTNEESWADTNFELSECLARLFGDEEYLQVAHKRSSLIRLAALVSIRAHNNGVRDFLVTVKMDDGDFDHVALSYERNEGDEKTGRAFRLFQVEENGDNTTGFLGPSKILDNRDVSCRLKKYFDSYRRIRRENGNVGSEVVFEDFVVCCKDGFRYGERVGRFVLEEAALRNTGKDVVLMADLLAFKDDFEGRRELVMFLKDGCVDLPRQFADCVFGNDKVVHQTEESCLLESYWSVLAREVVDPESMGFRKGFLDGGDLSATASHFRDQLWFRYVDSGEAAGADESEGGFRSYLASRVVELSDDAKEKIRKEAEEASPADMARYFTDLIAGNPDSKVLSLDWSDSWVRKVVRSLSGHALVNANGAIAFSREFHNGIGLQGDIADFRSHLRDGLESLGADFGVLQEYKFQGEVGAFSNYTGELLDKDLRLFLGGFELWPAYPGHEEVPKLVSEEMSKCLHDCVAESATVKFLRLFLHWVDTGVAVKESELNKFIDLIMKNFAIPQAMSPVNPDLGYHTDERDISSVCGCQMDLCGIYKGGCRKTGGKPETPMMPNGENAFAFACRYFEFLHECLAKNIGKTGMKTREMKMRVAYYKTILGENQDALDLTEGELDDGYDDTSRTMSSGFHHVRARALIGLGREEECVEHLLTSCVSTTFPTLEINAPAFRATINIVYDLVCRGKYDVARRILDLILNRMLENGGFFSDFPDRESDLCRGFGNLRARFDVRTTSSLQLSSAVFHWCSQEGGSKKEAMEILKIIHQFLKSFLGEDELETLQVKFLFARIYCRKAKGPGRKKGLQYLLELHSSLCRSFGHGDNVLNLLYSLHGDILKAGGREVALEALKTTHDCARKELPDDHPFTKKILHDLRHLLRGELL